MINKKITLSALSILVSLSLMAGATYAYFTDSATSTGNSFTAGELDINLRSDSPTQDAPFNVNGLEPGETVTRYITVTNDGDIDMQWKAYINSGDGGSLFNVLNIKEVTLHPSEYLGYTGLTTAGYTIAGPVNHPIITSSTPLSNLTNASTTPLVWKYSTAGAFSPNWSATYKIVVEMDPNASNSYQNSSWTGSMKFDGYQLTDPAF